MAFLFLPDCFVPVAAGIGWKTGAGTPAENLRWNAG